MLKRTLCLVITTILMLSLSACGFRESDITESEAFATLSNYAEENDLLDLDVQPDTPATSSTTKNNDGSRFTGFSYLPIEALVTTTPGNNEFTGNNYYINLYPLEYGDTPDGNPGFFVSGYALHAEDESFSSMAIGGIPSMDDWDDVFDSPYGFLISFQYVGYSEEYHMAYGIYISHEVAPDGFDQYA